MVQTSVEVLKMGSRRRLRGGRDERVGGMALNFLQRQRKDPFPRFLSALESTTKVEGEASSLQMSTFTSSLKVRFWKETLRIYSSHINTSAI